MVGKQTEAENSNDSNGKGWRARVIGLLIPLIFSNNYTGLVEAKW